MTTLYRHQSYTVRCDLCARLRIERVASDSCVRCSRPLCNVHSHCGGTRCAPCEKAYIKPEDVDSPLGSVYFWVPFWGLLLVVAMTMAGHVGNAFVIAGLVGIFAVFSAMSHSLVAAYNHLRTAKSREEFLAARIPYYRT